MRKSSHIMLAVAFAATALGGYWLTNPADETGFNFGAGLLFLCGLIAGITGLLLGGISLFAHSVSKKRNDDVHPTK